MYVYEVQCDRVKSLISHNKKNAGKHMPTPPPVFSLVQQ